MIKEDDNPVNPVDIHPEDYLITPADQKQALIDIEDYQRIANYHVQKNYETIQGGNDEEGTDES